MTFNAFMRPLPIHAELTARVNSQKRDKRKKRQRVTRDCIAKMMWEDDGGPAKHA